MLVLVAMVFALMFGIAGPASAVPSSEPRAAERGPNTDLVMSGTGPGQAVQGFIANPEAVQPGC